MTNHFTPYLNRNFWLLAALLVSSWLVLTALISDPVLNKDGMYYVDQARLYIDGGAFYESRWTLFSRFLAVFSRISGVDPYHVALIFIVLLRVLITGLIFAWLSGHQHRIDMPIAFVVAVSMPWLIDYQSFLVRDTFAWVALIVCLLLSENWTRTQRWRWLLFMLPVVLVAVLFRTEMLVLMVVPVWLLLVYGWRRGAGFTLTVLALLLLAGSAVVFAVWDVVEGHLAAYARVLHGASGYQAFPSLVDALAPHVNVHAQDELPKVLAVGLTSLPLFAVADSLGIFIVPLGYALASAECRKRALVDGGVSLWLMLFFFLVLLAFVFVMQFLSGRYAVPLAICLVPWVAHGLQQLWYSRPRLAKYIVTLAMISAVLGSLTTTSTKYLVKDLGEFLAVRSTQFSPVFFNDARIAFYAGEPMKSAASGALPGQGADLSNYSSLAVAFNAEPGAAPDWLADVQEKYGFSRVAYYRQDGEFCVALLVR